MTRAIFEEVGAVLGEKKLLMREGTLIDASIIAAPYSTKNRRRERDPEMHQSRKGNQWYFGMKAHIGTNEASGLMHGLAKVRAQFSLSTLVYNLRRVLNLMSVEKLPAGLRQPAVSRSRGLEALRFGRAAIPSEPAFPESHDFFLQRFAAGHVNPIPAPASAFKKCAEKI